jgi:hypothetical protein
MTKPRPYTRHGLHAIKAKVKVAGLAAIDGRTVAARALLDWRKELIADLGGGGAVSAQQMALVEAASRTRLYLDHLDCFLMSQRSLVNAKRKAVLPVLRERQTLADSLTRILTTLGLERRARKTVTLATYVHEKYGSASAAGEPPSPSSPTAQPVTPEQP